MAVGACVSLLRGGRLRTLSSLSMRFTWLALVGFGIEFVCIRAGMNGAILGIATPWLVGSALVAVFAIVNLRVAGIPIMVAGLSLNFIVMLFNGGYMPTTIQALQEAGHTDKANISAIGQPVPGSKDMLLREADARLWFLSDVFASPPAPFRFVFSGGDVLLAAGGAYFAYRALKTSDYRAGISWAKSKPLADEIPQQLQTIEN